MYYIFPLSFLLELPYGTLSTRRRNITEFVDNAVQYVLTETAHEPEIAQIVCMSFLCF